jgi:hypothetical protein
VAGQPVGRRSGCVCAAEHAGLFAKSWIGGAGWNHLAPGRKLLTELRSESCIDFFRESEARQKIEVKGARSASALLTSLRRIIGERAAPVFIG